ncbi:MAG: nicotinate-nucleotide adenylyltransferase [Gaiellaceae bacterium]|nr:nicotinate-nucleotide adenylyltransferase [Gaiellaceae bacterium]
MTALLGGAFDPPHNGHVAVAQAVREQLDPQQLLVLVADRPEHKDVATPVEPRLALTRAAFPGVEIEIDPYPRTIDLLRARDFADPLFVIGADQFADFLAWKEPDAVLESARLAVATRPGYPQEVLDAVLGKLRHPERVQFFAIEPVPISSREIRARVSRHEPIDDLVPAEVARLIAELGLYRT